MPLGVRRRLLAAASAALLVVTLVAPPAMAQTHPFRDPGLSLARRVDDLLGRLTTWDPQLIKRVGEAVGTEARGYNALNPDVWGLQLWAPVVNLLRDPRWGRNEEGYSEDPLLTGAISTAYGRGITGDDPDHLRAAPVLKHYLANNNEIRRDTTSSDLRPRVKHEYDEAAFRPAIAADAATGVMSSYNLVNGRPMTAHSDIGETVRGWTGRTLFNVTDAGTPNNLTGSQGYYATQAEADAAIVKAGLDSFTVDEVRPANTIAAIKEALTRGLLAEEDVDEAVRHILTLRFRLGEFDPDGGRYGHITPAVRDRWVVENAEHELMVGASSADIRGRAALRVRGETIPPRDMSRPTRAVNFDDHHGIRLADETRTHGDVLATGAGDWASYKDTALGADTRRITVRAANAGTAPVRVEVRLGAPDGSLAGSVNLSPTSGVYDYAEVSVPLTGATGRRDVYLVFHGEARVAALTLGG